MYIDATTIISAASVITALTVLGGVVVWCLKFVERQKKQDLELAQIRKELTLICFGTTACLQGLKEQGCDGKVTDALNRLEKHLNNQAHDQGA